MIYLLDIWNSANNTCIAPGVTLQGGLVRSNYPIPVPSVGVVLEYHGDKWRVDKRVFSYGDNGAPNYEHVLIDLCADRTTSYAALAKNVSWSIFRPL